MRSDALRTPRGATAALILLVAGAALAWLCLRVAVVQALPAASPLVASVDPGNPDAVLSAATLALARPEGGVRSTDLAAVRAAAASAPLDPRPYLILGQQASAAGQAARAVGLLEAGQRLDPRQRLIHAFLLQDYLKSRDYGGVGAQIAVLSRLVGPASEVTANALVLMSTEPEMLPAVRQTLARDPRLEGLVLAILARKDTDPARIFDLASPGARAAAGAPGGWGSALVSRLVEQGRYGQARAIWRNIYALGPSADGTVFNPAFRQVAASAPFNWTLAASSLGAADPVTGGLNVDYYGRETGDLANQTILLKPGRYRLAFTATGGKAQSESKLLWRVACTGRSDALVNAPVPGGAGAQRKAVEFTVPAGCPAQILRLTGEAGEFPDQITSRISDLTLVAVGGASS